MGTWTVLPVPAPARLHPLLGSTPASAGPPLRQALVHVGPWQPLWGLFPLHGLPRGPCVLTCLLSFPPRGVGL